MSCDFDLVTEKPPSIKFAIEPQISQLEMFPINTNKLNDTRKEKTFTTANNQLVEKENRYSVLEKTWLDCQYHDKDNQSIMTPEDLETKLQDPHTVIDPTVLNYVKGSMFGMALGDALGAHVEFRPRQYLIEYPVQDLQEGGTWGLKKGQVKFLVFL
ncbi:unnamed protein product [Rotaria sp. Silwood1]|nr:unnamed protein product [Rotaria sp. Silwood1]